MTQVLMAMRIAHLALQRNPSLSGGVVGIGVGLAGSQLLSTTAGWPLLISWGAVALALAFSGAVGVFFGFYPARRAAQLDPIQALRYE